jgi:hypothetical protein
MTTILSPGSFPDQNPHLREEQWLLSPHSRGRRPSDEAFARIEVTPPEIRLSRSGPVNVRLMEASGFPPMISCP